jgi:hypothetical protein
MFSHISWDLMCTFSRSEPLFLIVCCNVLLSAVLSHYWVILKQWPKFQPITGKTQHFQSHPVSFYDCKLCWATFSQPSASLSYFQPLPVTSIFSQFQLFPSTFIPFFLSSLIYKYFQPFSAIPINFHPLSAFLNYKYFQPISVTSINFHPLSAFLNYNYFQPVSVTPVNFHPLSAFRSYNYFQPISTTPINFQLLSAFLN